MSVLPNSRHRVVGSGFLMGSEPTAEDYLAVLEQPQWKQRQPRLWLAVRLRALIAVVSCLPCAWPSVERIWRIAAYKPRHLAFQHKEAARLHADDRHRGSAQSVIQKFKISGIKRWGGHLASYSIILGGWMIRGCRLHGNQGQVAMESNLLRARYCGRRCLRHPTFARCIITLLYRHWGMVVLSWSSFAFQSTY